MANQKKIQLQGFKFKPFSAKQLKLLNWWQENSPVNDKFMVVADGAIRSGKEQPLDAILFTPDGIKKMGDIKVGDYVFDRSGNPTKVLEIFPQGIKDVYRVTFNDGSSTECGLLHLWSYTTHKCITNKNYTMFTSTLEDIKNDLERYKDETLMHKRAGKYRFYINGSVKFNEKTVKIDPYLLGLLLGDGCFSECNSGITFINEDNELHRYIENILPIYNMKYLYKPRSGTHCAYGRLANSDQSGVKTTLRQLLEYYGLYGKKSETKFVPADYKFNSENVRLNILAGLLNTDGSVHVKNRPSISYCSVSKQLCDDVAFLARSLGMFVNTDRKPDMREKNKHICYSCNIKVSKDLYKLLLDKHKNRLNMNPVKDEVWKLIKSIEYIGKKECQCIYVDNDEHLYLTDDFIVTHNTVSMILSFVLFVMTTFNQQNAAMCGKSVGSFRRNVLVPLKQMLLSMDYDIIEHRTENYVEIIKGDVVNYFYIFGAKDESSQDLIQGITLCALLLDEVALMPESFFNQATARLSVEGAKCFCNCNPNSPYHWFYRNVLSNLKEKNGLYIHFTMKDNLSLSNEIIERYEKMYSGVFYSRYIEGRWVVANGLIYDMFSKGTNTVVPEEIPYEDAVDWCIGVDYGTGNATVFLLCMKTSDGKIYVCKEYYFAGRKEAQEQNDYEAQKTDLEFAEDMREFITESYDLTEKSYRQIDILVDPAASSFKLQLRRFHMRAKNAKNDVLDGIRTVATYMGKGDLKISTECVNLLREIQTYMWDEKAQLRGLDAPVKQNDHAVDSLRYSVMHMRDKNKLSDVTRNLGL